MNKKTMRQINKQKSKNTKHIAAPFSQSHKNNSNKQKYLK